MKDETVIENADLNSPPPAAAPASRPQRGPRALRNVFSNWGSYAFSLVITFFLSPYVVHKLGDSGYGVWVLIVSLTGYLGLLDLGVRGAVTRYVAKFHTQNKHQDASATVSSAAAIFALVGLIAISISLMAASMTSRFFHIPPDYQRQAQIVLALAGLTVASSLLGGVFGGIVVGLQRFDLVSMVEVASSGLRAVATVAVLYAGYGLISLSLVQLGFSVATALTTVWIVYYLYPELQIRWSFVNREYLRLIFSFSFYSFLLNTFGYLILYTDAVVISTLLPVAFVTYFSIAGNLVTYARGLLRGITQLMTPMASKLEAEGKEDQLRHVTLTGGTYATGLMLPICVTFFLRGGTFIGLWMGPSYASLCGQILWVLTISTALAAGPGIAWAVMFGISKHRYLVPIFLAEAICNLGLSIVLIKRMGVVGSAWGTTIPNVLGSLFFWPWFLRRTLHIPIRTYWNLTWIRPIVSAIPFAAASYGVEKLWPASNLAVYFSQVALLLPLALVPFWFLCVEAEQREAYWRRLRLSWADTWQRG